MGEVGVLGTEGHSALSSCPRRRCVSAPQAGEECIFQVSHLLAGLGWLAWNAGCGCVSPQEAHVGVKGWDPVAGGSLEPSLTEQGKEELGHRS